MLPVVTSLLPSVTTKCQVTTYSCQMWPAGANLTSGNYLWIEAKQVVQRCDLAVSRCDQLFVRCQHMLPEDTFIIVDVTKCDQVWPEVTRCDQKLISYCKMPKTRFGQYLGSNCRTVSQKYSKQRRWCACSARAFRFEISLRIKLLEGKTSQNYAPS